VDECKPLPVVVSPVSIDRTKIAMSPVWSMSSTPHASMMTSREEKGQGVAAQLEFESNSWNAVYRIIVSSAETIVAFNAGFEAVSLHRPIGPTKGR
jgi:hypothetical protein